MTSEIVYRLTTPKDKDLILEFLREHFYPDEPLTLASIPPGHDKHDELSAISHLANEPSTCLIAMSGDQIVGVHLAGPKGPEEEKLLLERSSLIPDTKWGKLLLFVATLERDAKVFEKYKVDKALHLHVLSVHRQFRGKGIARKIHQISIERARELGFPLYTCDCTSSYSARMIEQLGFECVNAMMFADYRDSGCAKQVFFPPDEHQIVKTYAKRL